MNSSSEKLFAFIFVPVLFSFMTFGLGVIIWVVTNFFEKIVDGFRMGALLKRPPLVTPENDIARRHVLELREKDHVARLARIKRHKIDAEEKRRREVSQAAEDVTEELARLSVNYLIVKKPLEGRPLYFREVLHGVAVGPGATGIRDARPVFTDLRHLARRFSLSEARQWIQRLPDARHLFIVEDEARSATKIIEEQALARLHGTAQLQISE